MCDEVPAHERGREGEREIDGGREGKRERENGEGEHLLFYIRLTHER